MPASRVFSEIRLVNGSTGDPVLYVDYPGKDDALLFDAGELCRLSMQQLGDLTAVFITHHHVDHFIGFDRIVRANIDADKTLSVFGPAGTIRKVYDRIRSYEYQYFPFQKIVLEVHEVHAEELVSARLECRRRFPEPELARRPWEGPVIFENSQLHVEAAFTDHTVPGLAFALVERPGFHADGEKLRKSLLQPGRWIGNVLQLLEEGADPGTTLEIQGGQFRLEKLAEMAFTASPGSRVAYVTDTFWSDAVREGLIRLARRAQRLYCDSFYRQAQLKQAEKYRHMTALHAAELAKLAKVDQLILMHFSGRYQGQYQKAVEDAAEIFPNVSAVLDSD